MDGISQKRFLCLTPPSEADNRSAQARAVYKRQGLSSVLNADEIGHDEYGQRQKHHRSRQQLLGDPLRILRPGGGLLL